MGAPALCAGPQPRARLHSGSSIQPGSSSNFPGRRDVSYSVRPVRCDQARSFVSLRLDDALTEFETAALDRHLHACAGCREFADDAGHVVELLRAPFPRQNLILLRHSITQRILQTEKWSCTSRRRATSACAPRLKLRPGDPTAHGTSSLPLLSSDPGGVRRQPLHRTRPSTPPRGLLTHIAASARNSTQL